MKASIRIIFTFCFFILIAACNRVLEREKEEGFQSTEATQPHPTTEISPNGITPMVATPATSDLIMTFEELTKVDISLQTDLIASPSHPNSYLSKNPVKMGETLPVIGSDQNGAWLLVIHEGTLGWIPSVYSRVGIGTLNHKTVAETSFDSCKNYLGAILTHSGKWESSINGDVLVQGLAYLPKEEKNFNEILIGIQVEETRQEFQTDVERTVLDAGGEVLLFTSLLKDMRQGNHVKFMLSNLERSSIPFQASFYNNDCSNLPLDQQGDITANPQANPILPMATRVIRIESTSQPGLTTQFDWNACNSDYASRLKVGVKAYVRSDPPIVIGIHEEPYKDSPFLGESQPGEEVIIVDGPSCSNKWVWWKIFSSDKDIMGWVSEGDEEDYWLIPESTSSSNLRVSPEQFIRKYYSLINQREYDQTWAMLSDNFKNRNHCCRSDGSFDARPYKEWWDTIRKVEVINVKTKTWNTNNAIIEIKITYYPRNGNASTYVHEFNLISDRSGESWLID